MLPTLKSASGPSLTESTSDHTRFCFNPQRACHSCTGCQASQAFQSSNWGASKYLRCRFVPPILIRAIHRSILPTPRALHWTLKNRGSSLIIFHQNLKQAKSHKHSHSHTYGVSSTTHLRHSQAHMNTS